MTTSWHRILVVVDEDDREMLETALKERGWEVDTLEEGSEARKAMQKERFACAVVADGVEERVRDLLTGFGVAPTSPVIGLVRSSDVSTAVDAMKLGAHQVLEIDREGWVESVLAAVEEAVPKGSAPFQGDPRDVVLRADPSPIDNILNIMPQVARADAPVLVTGESGTGKELIARVVHNMSPRSEGPFVAVNCSAIPDTLLESELFGYVKGAFTGANEDRDGQIRSSHGGTLFLDEIGEMPPQLQVKLLRVLQDKKVTPVGSTKPIDVDFRVIAATNRNLEVEIEAQSFREDLFYRLSVLPLHLPPLRERPNDIVVMAESFLEEQNRVNGTRLLGLTAETVTTLKRYEWPGNVRELQNMIQRLSILKRVGFIELEDLPEQFFGGNTPPPQLGLYVPSEGMDMADTLEKLEATLLKQALEKAGGNKAAAARLLNLNRTTLVEKVKRMQLEDD